MNIISIIRRIANYIQNLASELEIKNMTNLAQVLQALVHRAKDIEKMCMYTNTAITLFKDLNEKTKNIARRAAEDPSVVRESMEEFIQVLSKTISITLSNYLKLKLMTATLATLYIFTSTELTRMYAQSTLALVLSSILLWQGVILLLLILMNLTMSIFIIPIIPLTSIIISTTYLELADTLSKSLLLALHTTALVLSLIFIAKNINNYGKLKSFLKDLEKSIEMLTNTIRSIPRTALTPTTLDLNMYTDVYGDKAYELIKYVNDMQKLLKR